MHNAAHGGFVEGNPNKKSRTPAPQQHEGAASKLMVVPYYQFP
jgi:hypothetical protein